MVNLELSIIMSIITILFFTGLFGLVLNRKNILIVIMSIEIMLLAVNLNFIIISIYLDDIVGQIFVFFILAVSAAESAIGLAILVLMYRLKNSIELRLIKKKEIKM